MASLARAPAADPPSPGTYLRLRREAAGLTLYEVSLIYARSRASAPAAEMLLHDAEADKRELAEPGLRQLQRAFSFDAYVYLQLASGDLPVPAICRGCGCTWADACVDPVHGPFAWADRTETLCTACAARAPAA